MIPLLEGFKLIKSLRAGNSRYKRKKALTREWEFLKLGLVPLSHLCLILSI